VVITVILGAALFFLLERSGRDGVLGLAIATSVSAWANVALLGGTLVREKAWGLSGRFVSRLTRVLAACVAMACILVPASVFYPELSRLLLAKEIAVLAVCIAGALVYGVCLVLFRAVSIAELKATLRREPQDSNGRPSMPAGLD
jgi:putative peptidoglycan lipid II flippase